MAKQCSHCEAHLGAEAAGGHSMMAAAWVVAAVHTTAGEVEVVPGGTWAAAQEGRPGSPGPAVPALQGPWPCEAASGPWASWHLHVVTVHCVSHAVLAWGLPEAASGNR